MDEAGLIGAAQAGDLEAFNRLILVYQDQVYNLAYRILGDPHAADDAAQEAFISAFKGLRRYRGGSFRAWILRIVTNACYDELRRRKRRPAIGLEDLNPLDDPDQADSAGVLAAEDGDPESEALQAELAQALEDCLTGLPDEFRLVAVLVDVQGHDYQEASEVIGAPLGTVKSRLARARLRLRDCLQAHGELLPAAFRLEDEGNVIR
jgi:RNA polymerase sigma-70 factor (ECF subfamily)